MSERDDTGTSATGRRSWPRWMRLLLVASLALNLFVAGALATAAFRHRHGGEHPARFNIYGFARSLPHERRREVFDLAREERQAMRPFRAELRRARAAYRAALSARPFDAGRYRQAHDALLAAEVGARQAAHKLFDRIVLQLSDDEREKLARWLARGDRPWKRRRGREGEPPLAGSTDDAAANQTTTPLKSPTGAAKSPAAGPPASPEPPRN